MVRNTKNSAVVRGGHGLGRARDAVDRYVGTWFSLAWKLAAFYALWITLAYLGMTNFTMAEGRQIAAIAYWFGWMFAGFTLTAGLLVTLGTFLDRFRFVHRNRKY